MQLLICIVAEYQRLKQPSLLRACRISTQKLLYFVVFVAAMLRGAYFTTPVSRSININTFFFCIIKTHVFTGCTAARLGFELGVCLLSTVDDLRIAGGVPVGGSEY